MSITKQINVFKNQKSNMRAAGLQNGRRDQERGQFKGQLLKFIFVENFNISQLNIIFGQEI